MKFYMSLYGYKSDIILNFIFLAFMLLFPQYSETTKRKRTSALGTESIKTQRAQLQSRLSLTLAAGWSSSLQLSRAESKKKYRESLEVIELLLKQMHLLSQLGKDNSLASISDIKEITQKHSLKRGSGTWGHKQGSSDTQNRLAAVQKSCKAFDRGN